jgi:hypothetical protein
MLQHMDVAGRARDAKKKLRRWNQTNKYSQSNTRRVDRTSATRRGQLTLRQYARAVAGMHVSLGTIEQSKT